jgi:hypothetical protein
MPGSMFRGPPHREQHVPRKGSPVYTGSAICRRPEKPVEELGSGERAGVLRREDGAVLEAPNVT